MPIFDKSKLKRWKVSLDLKLERFVDNKWRMPAVLDDDLAYEWLLGSPSPERMQELARIQVPSKDMEYCTITKEYLQRLANPTEYPTLPGIDMSYMDMGEELLYPAA